MNNLTSDLSLLTSIPEYLLKKLNSTEIYAIAQTTLEDELNEKELTEIDLGIGTLYIKHSDGEIKYKFIPSEELQKQVSIAVSKKLNSMENMLTEKLGQKLLEAYKDLC